MTARRAPRLQTAALAVPTAVCVALTAFAAPAAAARPDSSTSVRSGERASVSWTELDPGDALGLPGNTHVGQLWIEDTPFGVFADGVIFDYECDPGEVPGGHEGPGTCDDRGARFLSATGPDSTLTVSGSTAQFSGTLTVSNGGHGEPGTVLAQVPATITWSTSSAMERYRASSTYTEKGISYRSRVTGLRADVETTTVGGALGRMGFADDEDDVATGTFETYTETFRERIR